MENYYQQKIVDKIKREPEIEVLDQFTCEDPIVGNIKHEPERHFVFIMPDDPEVEELKEMKIILKKFDLKFKSSAKLFETYFICNKCEYTNKCSGNLKKHLEVCIMLQKCKGSGLLSKSENIKECGLCDLKFDCDNCKKIHIDREHRKGTYWYCTKCHFKTSKKDSLKNHFQTHVKQLSCATCNQIFALNKQLKNHQLNHRHGIFAEALEAKFECSTCDRSFATKRGLYRHEREVHINTKFHCDICGKIFKTKKLLRSHIQTHLKVPCPICQHMLAPNRLQRHSELHLSSLKLECDDCEKVFSTRNSLYDHKKQNHEIDEVQCDLCAKIFKNKLLLRNHMRNHLKVQCTICRKPTIKAKLKQHMKMHLSGQKSLLCNNKGCQQKFENIKELNDHEEIHIGPKNYKCPKCNHQMTTLQMIKLHMKRMHKN